MTQSRHWLCSKFYDSFRTVFSCEFIESLEVRVTVLINGNRLFDILNPEVYGEAARQDEPISAFKVINTVLGIECWEQKRD